MGEREGVQHPARVGDSPLQHSLGHSTSPAQRTRHWPRTYGGNWWFCRQTEVSVIHILLYVILYIRLLARIVTNFVYHWNLLWEMYYSIYILHIIIYVYDTDWGIIHYLVPSRQIHLTLRCNQWVTLQGESSSHWVEFGELNYGRNRGRTWHWQRPAPATTTDTDRAQLNPSGTRSWNCISCPERNT